MTQITVFDSKNIIEMCFSELKYLKNFWLRRDFRDIFEDFQKIKNDKSKNFSGYGLFEYIDEEKE